MGKAWIYHPERGYFVGECLGMVFYEDAVGIDLSPVERPIEFESEQEATEYMDSWIACDGQAFVTVNGPGNDAYEGIVYQRKMQELEEIVHG